MSLNYDIAVLGATGTVGEAILTILLERSFPVGRLYPLASKRSAGSTVLFNEKPFIVEDVADFDFNQVQIALFSAGAQVSAQYAPLAADAGCVVIDNTSQFRYDPDIPLVIPEVNPEKIADYRNHNIIANPNCSTIQMLVALKPIYDYAGIARINVTTYQAVSGAGRSGITELASQTANILNGQPVNADVFAQQIAFNVLPHIDAFQENGYTREEMKMVWETQKILADDQIRVNPTAVRVPVFYGHSEAIHLETQRKISADEAYQLLRQAPGVMLCEDQNNYPTPVNHGTHEDAVFVGRVREDISHPQGLDLWVVADNVRKGAGLNAVQIAELLVSDYLS